MELKDLFGTSDAAKYIGMSVASLKRYVRNGYIEPIPLGERIINGRAFPHGYVFTRRMLDHWLQTRHRNDVPLITPTNEERKSVYNTANAARYLGISPNAVKQAYHVREMLHGTKIGNDVVFLQRDLDAYKKRQRPAGPNHPRAIFTADDVRQIRTLSSAGMSVPAIMEELDLSCDETAVYGVLSGRTYSSVK